METLSTAFRDIIKEVMRLSKTEPLVTERNVYQPGSKEILPFLDQMVKSLCLPGSRIEGMDNLEELLAKAEAGKSCLLLPEHYSNMDLSLFSWFVRQAGGRGADIAEALVAIAGMKLTEDDPVVAAFASAYTRLVIYPSRSLAHLDTEKDRAEIVRSNTINRAAMKTLLDIKVKGKLVLVFPSGTRYRPWDPSTKKGVREIDSYIRSFDYMCFVAVNGEVLHVRQKDMLEDSVGQDLVLLSAGPVLSCAEFREKARAAAEAAGIEDKKQATADAIMEELERMHTAAEERRRQLLKQDPPRQFAAHRA
ncbi:MAG: 1-acyl-sn-glycerol-3-phosphate acyltransferase [Treponema sp.]|jgi:glycerol-3-phosphate O-acyltransferase|nr:1-acyl-sn-glycerol-3-phosphate acyltransferase [Treponema sp.]